MDSLDLSTIVELIGNFTFGGVMLFLFTQEQKNHASTRQQARDDLREASRTLLEVVREQTETLKEIAGIRANMWNVQNYRNRESDTRPLPPLNGGE